MRGCRRQARTRQTASGARQTMRTADEAVRAIPEGARLSITASRRYGGAGREERRQSTEVRREYGATTTASSVATPGDADGYWVGDGTTRPRDSRIPKTPQGKCPMGALINL
eukprot:3203037-Prymnesium_polylepis.2